MIATHRPALTRRLAGGLAIAALALTSLLPAASHTRAATSHAANDTLTIGWSPETVTLDPAGPGQNPDIYVMVNIYNQLLKVANDGNTIQPDLATSYDISKDGKTYTFHLRPNVTFTNGMKLTSEDVRFALVRAAETQRSWAYLLTAMKSVTAPDPLTVKITLKYAWGPFLADMSFFTCGVYPEAYFKKVGETGMVAHPIGSGPYALQEWKKGQYLRLQKNPGYWDAAKYPMQHVEFDLLPSDNTKIVQVQGGQLDVDYFLPPSQVAALKGSSAARVQMDTSTRTGYFALQTKVAPLGDVNVRQAINHAINRPAIVKALLYGYGKPANSFLPVGSLFYDPNLPVPSYDPALAKQFLAKSSVPNGFNMTIEVGTGAALNGQLAQVIQQELAPLGIKVTVTQVDPTALNAAQQKGNYHSVITGWTNDIPDPDELVTFAVDPIHGGANSFFTYYSDPSVIKLNTRAEQTNDAATRKTLYSQIQKAWAAAAPIMPLYYIPYINAVSTKVHGFSENPLGYFNLQGVTKS